MRASSISVLAFAGISLAGCATSFDVSEGQSHILDATKRVVITGVNWSDERIVCAEPSPDAIASLAASLALKAELPQGPKGELSGSFAETVASIGLRTAAIQILRDLGYRACEGVMNGVITQSDYDQLIGGVSSATLGLVAIEGLTQMRPAPAVVISPGASASTKEGTQAQTTGTTINVTMQGDAKGMSTEYVKEIASQVVKIVEIVAIDSKLKLAPMYAERAKQRVEQSKELRQVKKKPSEK